MGGYRNGTDPALDKAVQLVPRIYDVLRQSPEEPPSADAFQDVARALTAEPAEPAADGDERTARTPQVARYPDASGVTLAFALHCHPGARRRDPSLRLLRRLSIGGCRGQAPA